MENLDSGKIKVPDMVEKGGEGISYSSSPSPTVVIPSAEVQEYLKDLKNAEIENKDYTEKDAQFNQNTDQATSMLASNNQQTMGQ